MIGIVYQLISVRSTCSNNNSHTSGACQIFMNLRTYIRTCLAEYANLIPNKIVRTYGTGMLLDCYWYRCVTITSLLYRITLSKPEYFCFPRIPTMPSCVLCNCTWMILWKKIIISKSKPHKQLDYYRTVSLSLLLRFYSQHGGGI